MTTMPLARIHGPGDIRLDSVERPRAGPRALVIQVERCGLCGSDLSYAKIGGLPGAASPFAIGHEFSGVVVEATTGDITLSGGDDVDVDGDLTAGTGAVAIHVDQMMTDPDVGVGGNVDIDAASIITTWRTPASSAGNSVCPLKGTPDSLITPLWTGPVTRAAAKPSRTARTARRRVSST